MVCVWSEIFDQRLCKWKDDYDKLEQYSVSVCPTLLSPVSISPSSNLLALKYSSKIFFTRGIRTPPPNISTECTLSKVKPAIDNAEGIRRGQGEKGKISQCVRDGTSKTLLVTLVNGQCQSCKHRGLQSIRVYIALVTGWLLAFLTLVNGHSQSSKHIFTSSFKFTSSDLRVQICVVVELFGFDGVFLVGG